MTVGIYLDLDDGVIKAMINPPRSNNPQEFRDMLHGCGIEASVIKIVADDSLPAKCKRAIALADSIFALSNGDEGSFCALFVSVFETILSVGREYGRAEQQQAAPGGLNANL